MYCILPLPPCMSGASFSTKFFEWFGFVTTMKIMAIFKKPSYIISSLLVSILIFGVGVWLPIRSVASFYVAIQDSFFPLIPLLPKIIILNIPKVTLVLLAITAFLGGVNASLVIYYFRERARKYRESGLGVMGVISGVVGVCCASCGSIVLSSLLGISAAGTVLGVLPLKGLEFSMFAVVVLLGSIYHVSRKIVVPATCRIE